MTARCRPIASDAPDFIRAKPLNDEGDDSVGDWLGEIPIVRGGIPAAHSISAPRPAIHVRNAFVGSILKWRVEHDYLRIWIWHLEITRPESVPENADQVSPGKAAHRTFPDHKPRPAAHDFQLRVSLPD